MRVLQAELLVSSKGTFGEGPLWDERDGLLWWTDIPGRTIHRFDPRSLAHQAIPVRLAVGAMVPRTAGGFAAATEDGFAMLDPDGTLELVVPLHEGDDTMRMNDGTCDSAGRFYASTMDQVTGAPIGQLWRLGADRSAHAQHGGLGIGNGLAWSADGRSLFFIDSPTRTVQVFDVDLLTGDLSGVRTAFAVDARLGVPDGMCIDDEGALWIAFWGGGCVRRFTPDGELLAIVEVPVANVTCISFLGDRLVITTAGATAPGGALFVAEPGLSGPPADAYPG
jgi:sugar lactone lactonase YvrE